MASVNNKLVAGNRNKNELGLEQSIINNLKGIKY